MENKERYIALARDMPIPFFLSPQWMDVVCDNWDVALAKDDQGQVIGALPYQIKNKFGMEAFVTPWLTPTSGPWIKPLTGNLAKELGKYHKISEAFADQLNRATYKNIKLSPSQYPAHGWYWKGYQLSTKYTYRLDISSADQVFENCRNTIRTDIRNAEESIQILPVKSAEEFIGLMTNQVGFQYDLLTPTMVHQIFELKENIIPLKAIEKDNPVGCSLFIRSLDKIYYLIGARLKEGANLSLTAMIWYLINQEQKPGRILDFEGSMLKSVEPYFRRFGGTPTPYISAIKMPKWMGLFY